MFNGYHLTCRQYIIIKYLPQYVHVVSANVDAQISKANDFKHKST